MTLRQYLLDKGFVKITLSYTVTNHLEIKANLNGVSGRFILDTGASSSCVGFEVAEKFNLVTQDSDVKAAGAGSTTLKTQKSLKNNITIGKWQYTKLPLVVFDMTHVNSALNAQDVVSVDGIIGADILKKGKAVIDYKNLNLYLK